MSDLLLGNSALIAAAGAFCVQLLGITALANVPISQRPNFKDIVYWTPFLIHPLLGAFLVCVHGLSGTQEMSAWLALNVGISAPLVFKSIAVAADPGISVEPDA